jgi:hypothetical protein
MDFNQNKRILNRELEQFVEILGELLPQYTRLIKKNSLDTDELKELGEIEHFLIEVNSKINAIKNMLDQDLFGHSLDLYYKYKEIANKGDLVAKQKLDRLKNFFNESLQSEQLVNWN